MESRKQKQRERRRMKERKEENRTGITVPERGEKVNLVLMKGGR